MIAVSKVTRIVVRIAGITAIAIFVGVALTGARKGKPSSGIMKDGVFTDSANGFSVPISNDWKAKVGSAESDVRLTLIHENPPLEKPRFWRSRSNRWRVVASSNVRFITFSSELSSSELVDSLVSDSASWKIGEGLWTEMNPPLSRNWTIDRVVHTSRRTVSIGARQANQWRGKICYTSTGSESAMEMGLFLTAIEREKHVLIIAASGNEKTMDWLTGETTKLLDSLKFLR